MLRAVAGLIAVRLLPAVQQEKDPRTMAAMMLR
jgi:hypothetical protein